MRKILISFVIFGICVGIFLSQNPREYANFKITESTNKAQQTIEGIAVEVVGFLEDFGCKAGHKSAQCPKSSKSTQNAPKSKLTNQKRTMQMLPNPFPSAHSSSLTDLGDRLLITYFAGSKEGASDVKIMAHFVDKGTLHSTPPREILSAQTLSKLSGKFIKKLGNPLVFKSADGNLHFFVVGVSLGGWATSKIYHLQLIDDLSNLIFKKELRLGLLGNFSHLIRTPPLMLENGGFMLPLYHEFARKYPLVAFFDENGEFSHALRLNYLKNQLQPTIIALNKSECLAFFRNHKAYQNASFLQKCERGGAIWELPSTTNLKAFDDSYLLLHYKNAENKSRILLLYNDGKVAESSNSRRSLGLYYLAESSLDSAPKSPQDKFIFLQNIDAVDESYPNEVSYPSAVIDENALFVGYTYNRKGIKLQKIELAEIEKKIAESTLFTGLEFNGLGRDSSFCESKKKQKLLKGSCEAPKTRPLRGAKNRIQASSSASADFLLEAEKARLSPKSEKAAAFWRVGERGGGVALFAKETNKNNGKGFAESSRDSSHPPLPQNDNIIADSADFTLSKHDANSSNADEFLGFCEASDADKTNGLSRKRAEAIPKKSLRDAEFANIFGIYLLFLSIFFFLTKSLSKRVKYLALPCFVALISIPFIFVLWDYYSIVMLFYSLFGGASLFCALLCAKYILREVLQACRFCESIANDKFFRDSSPAAQNDKIRDSSLRKCFAQNDKCKGDSANSCNLAFTLAIFSIPLFLGHLGLINFDILRNEIASAIFVSAFIVVLFWVDKWAFIFALIALVLTKSLFGLFDGYLLIFSVVYCAIWATKWIFKKIIAQA